MACSGEVKESVQKGQMQVTKFSLNNTRSVAIVLSEKFSVKSEKVDGIKVNYYYYDDENPEKSIEFAKKSLRLFSNKFGRYPYSTYSIVQTKFIQGGMEFPSLVMISDELDGLAYGEVIVHETAHQWWQTTVGNNEVENGFLDEGLAEYSVVIFYEYYKEYCYTRKDLIKSSEDTFKVFCSVYDKLFGKVDTSMNRSLNEFSSEYEYVNISYIKPCIMYDTLRKTIGDERFFKALKRYYSQYSFKNATPSDMMGAFEKVGADSNGFFKSFFEGKEVI
jgi:aminopeptidase N